MMTYLMIFSAYSTPFPSPRYQLIFRIYVSTIHGECRTRFDKFSIAGFDILIVESLETLLTPKVSSLLHKNAHVYPKQGLGPLFLGQTV
jgi:hypothetical protein